MKIRVEIRSSKRERMQNKIINADLLIYQETK